jgi:glycogen(starch) synthase
MAPEEAPRRVLITADAVGGVWTYAIGLIRGLCARGIAVDLAVVGPPPSAAQRAEALAIAGLTLHEADFALEWMADPWSEVERTRLWLAELAARTRPDLAHLSMYAIATAPWPVELPLLVVGHSCVRSWWRAVHGVDAPPAWERYRREVAAGLRAADAIVAPTRAMLDALREHYGPLSRARVIFNAMAAASSAPTPPEAKSPEVLSAGRLWDEAKNLATLDRAAACVPWPVLVAGDTTHPDGQDINAGNVRLLGRLDARAMAAAYARAAIYCLPARYEPFGLSVLEAASAGCALVLGDIPSLRELWSGAAVFVDPKDDLAIARALTRLAVDPSARERMAEAARARAHVFAPARMVDAYLATYAEIAATARRRRTRSPACAS